MSPIKTLKDAHSCLDELQLPLVRAAKEKGSPLTDEERARVMRGEHWSGQSSSPSRSSR